MKNNQNIQLSHLLTKMTEDRCPVHLAGLAGSERAYTVSRLFRQLNAPLVIVTQSIKEAEQFVEDLEFFLHPANPPLYLFKPYSILSQNLISFSSQDTAHRIRILYQITQSHTPPIIVTTPAALHQRLLPQVREFHEPWGWSRSVNQYVSAQSL